MQGQLNIELNDVGRSQARRVADALRSLGISEKVDAVVSSDLSRASETADIVAAACPGARRWTDAGLREINFGNLQGQLAADIRPAKAEVMGAWAKGDLARAFPGGESAEAVVGRGLRALRDAAGAGECVVVVAHGGLLRWCAIGIELGEAAAVEPKSMAAAPVAGLMSASVVNCCCSRLEYDHEARRFRPGSWFEVLDPAAAQARDDTG